jgi:surfeit locus 1 family protein
MGWFARVGLTAAAAAVIIAFVLLGRWQWSAANEARYTEPRPGVNPVEAVVPLENYVPLDAIGSRVTVRGTRMPALYRLISSRSGSGVSDDPASCWRIEPVVMASGAAVPVVVSAGRCAALSELFDDSPPITVDLVGTLQPSEPPVPPRDAVTFASITTDVLVQEWPYQLHDGYVVVEGITPIRANPPVIGIDLRSGAYALQWWFFAVFAAVIWWRAVRPVNVEPISSGAPANVSGGPDPINEEGHRP